MAQAFAMGIYRQAGKIAAIRLRAAPSVGVAAGVVALPL
jgi:hypothetical protein